MIYISSIILLYLTYIGIQHMLWLKKNGLKLRHNKYHLDRAYEYFEMYLDTGDADYLTYYHEELKKIQY